MKRLVAATLLGMLIAAGMATAQEAPSISAPQFQRILKFLDTIGAKTTLAPPTSQNLGLSDDPKAALPVVSIRTNDRKVYFSRSELNPDDYIVVVRGPDSTYSYMFLTHADLKLVRGLYLEINDFPKDADITSPKVRAIYDGALIALVKDADKTKVP